ncbi:MAG: hypothetical protein ACI8ZB_000403 [Desulforhopalus sp.]|jgi:hypothetical protein
MMKKNSKRLIPFVFPLLGFVLILLALNGYQYFKLKRDVSDNLIRGLGEAELRELKMSFLETEELLLLIRDWGKNDVLLGKGITPLNKKLIPLLSRRQMVSGVTIAADSGDEYLLYVKDEHFITRHLKAENGTAVQIFKEWDRDVNELSEWTESKSYDPRKVNWYTNAGTGERVQWTGVYPLPVTNKPGLTASISWQTQGESNTHMVSAVHVSLARVEKILNSRRDTRPGLLFLVRPDESFLILREDVDSTVSVDVDAKAVQSLIEKWVEKGKPTQGMLRLQNDRQSWVGSFYDVGKSENLFWVGVAAKDKELVGWLDQSLFSIDLVEFLVAIGGGVIILLIMRKNGILRFKREKKSPLDRVHEYINRGEGGEVEFKSTVRTNLKTGTVGKEIEFAWLKTIVAFLNSDGGCLLMGVSDAGEICGLEADNFENNDRCLLHVKNLLNQYVGAEYSPVLEISLAQQKAGLVVMVECQKANDPVFFKVGKNEEFYIRSGPSSVKLSPSQIVNFVQQNKK